MPLPSAHAAGEDRILACQPPRLVMAAPPLSATFPPLPRDQWREVDLGTWNPPQRDQDGFSECVGEGSATALTVAWAQAGYPPQVFSAGFIYSLINGGRDEGAVVSDAATVLLSTGCCLVSEVPDHTIDRRRIPQTAYQTASRYKVARLHHCGSFDEMGTALSLQMPVVGGYLLGQNFMNLRKGNAVAPVPDRVVGGHCMAALRLRKGPGGDWQLGHFNSWTAQWGDDGWCWLTEAFVTYTIRQWGMLDAYSIEAVAADPQSDPGPQAKEA